MKGKINFGVKSIYVSTDIYLLIHLSKNKPEGIVVLWDQDIM